MSELNEAQQAAVEARESFVIVPASPGSGKTHTLVARIHSLIQDGSDPKRIICITFTQAGAKEMADRLGDVKLGYIGTLHGFCFRLLRQHGHKIGFRDGVSLATEEVAEEVFRETVATLGWKGSLKDAQESDDRKADLVRRAYRDALKRSNLVDYQTVLEEGLAVIEADMPRFDDLLVDEVQDSAEIDWKIYDAIQADRKFLVGDCDQSCFQFRGARPELMVAATNRPNAVVIPLELNYRSDVLICEAANRLIVNNPDRIKKWVLPNTETLGVVEKRECRSHLEEMSEVALWVHQRLLDTPAGEIAVLLRTNALVDQFRSGLAAAGVPISRPESTPLPKDWHRALDLIGLWLNPTADILASRFLKGRADIGKLRVEAIGRGCSMASLAVAQGLLVGEPLLLELVAQRLAMAGIDRGTVELVASRVAALPMPNPSLADLMSDLWQLKAVPEKADAKGIFVGTLHSSKGREFDAVALPAFEDGIIPSLSKTASIEEERNLAFVGVTRARHNLLITWAKTRDTQFKRGVQYLKSRFIGEMDMVDWAARTRGTTPVAHSDATEETA